MVSCGQPGHPKAWCGYCARTNEHTAGPMWPTLADPDVMMTMLQYGDPTHVPRYKFDNLPPGIDTGEFMGITIRYAPGLPADAVVARPALSWGITSLEVPAKQKAVEALMAFSIALASHPFTPRLAGFETAGNLDPETIGGTPWPPERSVWDIGNVPPMPRIRDSEGWLADRVGFDMSAPYG